MKALYSVSWKSVMCVGTAMLLSTQAVTQTVSPIKADKQRFIVAAVAKCIVQGRETFFRRAVLAGNETALFPSAEDGARAGDCYAKVSGDLSGGSIQAPVGWLAPIANYLVQLGLAKEAVFRFDAVPPLSYTLFGDNNARAVKPNSAQAVQNARNERKRALLALGECAARSQPSLVHTLLLADLMSPAEDSAFAALNEDINRCAAGVNFTPAREDLREALALSFYRLASAGAVATDRVSAAEHGS